MSSYIGENREELGKHHYIQKAQVKNNYWFDFSRSRLEKYKSPFGNNFCLVVHGNNSEDDDYIIP